MKLQLLLFLLLLSSSTFAQFSHSIYSTQGLFHRHSIIIERNNEMEVVSLHGSSLDTLRVTLISIDENGNTSNYRMAEYSPFDMSYYCELSGAGVNSNGEITLNIQRRNDPLQLVDYFTMNPSTGVLSYVNQLPLVVRSGFSRSRVKGDSLITYFRNASGGNNGIHRVSASMTTPSNFTIEVADPTLTTDYFVNTGYPKAIELMIDGNEEYVGLSSHVIKRNGQGSYQVLAMPAIPYSAVSLIKNSSNEIVAFQGSEYSVINSSFAITSSGALNGTSYINRGAEEIYLLENGNYRIWSLTLQNSRRIDLDPNFNVISENRSDNFPFYSTKIGDKIYLIGARFVYESNIGVDGEIFSNSGTGSVSVLADDLLSPPEPFIDYKQQYEHHNFRFSSSHCGESFYDGDISEGFTYELDSIKRDMVYTSKLNFGAKTISGDTISTTGYYYSTSIPGPYTNASAYNFEEMDQYNRGYYVTREMIEAHITGIGLNDPTYVIPFAIREWPAHGEVSKGQASNLAGFVDLDGNYIYNPENGDYPSIYGDACLLNMFHQSSFATASTQIETHQYYFSFDCDSSQDLQHAIFTRTDNFTRSQDLVDVYAGTFVEFDCGYADDDFIGTNVELGMIYAYNADFHDENSGGDSGFGDSLAAIGLISLQGVKLNEIGIDRPVGVGIGESINGLGFGDGIPDNEYYTLESSVDVWPIGNTASYYQTMTGNLPSGAPQTANGIDVRHLYVGNSDPLFYSSQGVDHGNNYSEMIVGNNGGDRRISGASGPGKFNKLDTLTIYNAFTIGIDFFYNSPDSSLSRLFERGTNIRDMFRSNSTPCGRDFGTYVSESVLSVEEPSLNEILIFPNPAKTSFQMKGITGNTDVQIIDLSGRIVNEKFDFYNGQEISIRELENAVYLVLIEDEIGRYAVRLVKR